MSDDIDNALQQTTLRIHQMLLESRALQYIFMVIEHT